MRPTLLSTTFLAFALLAPIAQAGPVPNVDPGEAVTVTVEGAIPEGASVYVDDRLADSFARIEGTTLTVTPPFATAGLHRIEIRDADGATLAEQAFRIGNGAPLFDSIEHSGSADLTTTQTFTPKSDTSTEGHYDTYDLRADSQIKGTRGRWTFTGGGEVIGAGRASRTPFGDKAIDASRLEFAARYAGEDLTFDAALGDLSYSGLNELVAGGVAGRGVKASASFLDGRVHVSAGAVTGVDVIGWRRGAETPDGDNFRAVADIKADLLRDGPVKLSVTASALKARRTLSTGFGVSGLDDGEDNTVMGVGADAEAWDGRLRYRGRFAFADYRNPAALNAGIDGFGSDSGQAQTHRVEADLLQENLSLTVHAGYARTDRSFHSIAAGAFPDRQTVETGFDASYGNVDVSARVAQHTDNLEDSDKRLSTETGSVEGAISYRFDDGDDDKGVLSVLKPSVIEVSASRTTLRATNGDVYLKATGFGPDTVPDQTETTVGLALDWSTPLGETSLGYDLSLFDQGAKGNERADTSEHAVTVSHGIRSDDWSIDGHASFTWGRDEDPFVDGKSQSIDYGIRARLAPEGWPELSVAYDRGRAHDVFRAYHERETAKTERLSVNLNLTPVIARLDPPAPVDVTLGYQMSRNSIDSTGFFAAQDDQRFKLNVSTRF